MVFRKFILELDSWNNRRRLKPTVSTYKANQLIDEYFTEEHVMELYESLPSYFSMNSDEFREGMVLMLKFGNKEI